MAISPSKRTTLLKYVGILTLLVLIIGAFSDWIVEWLWLDGVGYTQVFWTIKGTQFLLFFGALIVSLLYVLPNIYYLGKRIPYFDLNLGKTPFGNVNLARFSARQIRMVLYTAGTLLSLFFSFAYFMQWDSYFRFHWNETVGRLDPVFSNDIGFYLFRLPFIEIIQNSFMVLVFFVTVLMLVIYLATGSISLQKSDTDSDVQASQGVLGHISVNIGLWLLLMAWSYYLQRYQLLYDSSGVVYGAGYTDINILLPTFWVMIIGCLVLAFIAFYQTYRNRMGWLLKGGLVVLAISIVGQVVLPPAVQKFSVEPNELELETPHLKDNIELTRQAYNLDSFNERNYDAGDTLSFSKIEDNRATLQNIRLWDPRLIIQTYRQLQEIRLYYQFFNVDLDRYRTDEGYKQMMVSARELSPELPAQAQNWVNEHLQYTHGYGMVMSPVAEIGPQGDPRLVIKDLPPVSELGDLNPKQSAIYYGETDPDYKLVNTNLEELDYPSGDQNVYTNYDGDGGVSIDGFLEQLLFAWEFGDFNLLLTDYIREGSKIQFWKNVTRRVNTIAPFLKLEDDPYLVLSEGKLYWMLDAYTTSSDYPYSESFNGQYNYIRNSVKVVIDAFHGSVDFYVSDEDDPVLNVYRDIFPDLFQPLDAMSADLKQHVRYPKRLFEVQMQIFNAYHMTNPQVFYNNEDLWTRPNEKYGGKRIKMEPYYILSKLPGEDELQYLLISPLTPNNRDNMISWMAAKSDFPDYGQVEVFNLPKERLFLGPAQIEAKIDQDTEISRQLSLWDQRGSNVIRGNLMIIPIEDSFLYVEPVFLIADDVDIPQLQRVIATTGEQVVMQPNLDMAIEELFGKAPAQPITEVPSRSVQIPQDTTQAGQQQPQPQLPVQTEQLEELKTLWSELQTALQDNDWEEFGQKMQEIQELLDEE
jgi:uncharacterized membrane protein (UPF0182 family)